MSDSAIVELNDLDVYARLDALSQLLEAVVLFESDVNRRHGSDLDGLDPNDLVVKLDSPGITHRDLFDRIWPGDEDPESANYYEAAVVSTRIEKNLYALLAGPFGQEWLIDQAMNTAAAHERMQSELRKIREADSRREELS